MREKVLRKIVLINEAIDRDSEKVIVENVNMKAYLENPIVLYNHSFNNVLGVFINIRKDGNEIIADGIEFASELNEVCKIAKQQFIDGTLKAFSGGLKVNKVEQFDNYLALTATELIEGSLTPVGSNPEALSHEKTYSNFVLKSFAQKQEPKNNLSMKEIAKSVGLPDTATESEILDKIKGLKQEAEAQSQKHELLCQTVKKHVGKENALFVKAFEKDYDLAFEILAQGTPPPAPDPIETKSIDPVTAGVPVNGGFAQFIDAIKSMEGNKTEKTFDWYQKNDPQGLVDLQKNKPAEFEKLFNQKIGGQK